MYEATPGAAITTNLSLAQDAARANLGAAWRMPTAGEFEELYNNCTHVWTTVNGVYGYRFTSNVNGNSIFIPAAGSYDGLTLVRPGQTGHYWSSSYESILKAFALGYNDLNINPKSPNEKRDGFTVRAVFDL